MVPRWPAKLAILTLIVTVFPWQYGVYIAGKILVCLVAVFYLVKKPGKFDDNIKWPLIFVAILYNPLLPLYLYMRGLWIIADLVAIWIFWRTLRRIRE